MNTLNFTNQKPITFTTSLYKEITNPFVAILNHLLLIAYAGVLILEFRRYVIYDDFRIYIVNAKYIIILFMILVSLIKITYYFKSYKKDSIACAIMLIFIIFFSYAKYDGNIIALLSYWPSHLTLAIAVVAMYRVPIDSICRTHFTTLGTLYCIRVIGVFTKILPTQYVDKGHRLNINTLGFGSYNIAMMYFFFIAISWIYLIRNKKNSIICLNLIIISIISLFLYKVTQSRTSTATLMMIVLIILVLIILDTMRFTKSVSSIIKKSLSFIALIMPLGSFIITVLGAIIFNYAVHLKSNYDISTWSSFPSKLETFLSRFFFFSEDCTFHGIPMPWYYKDPEMYGPIKYSLLTGGEVLTPCSDNAYHVILITYGPIALILLLFFFQLWAIRAYKNKDYRALTIILALSLLNIMEGFGLQIGWDAFALVPFALLYATNEYSNNDINTTMYHHNHSVLFSTWHQCNSKNKNTTIVLALLWLIITGVILPDCVRYQYDSNLVSRKFYLWMCITALTILFSQIALSFTTTVIDKIDIKH